MTLEGWERERKEYAIRREEGREIRAFEEKEGGREGGREGAKATYHC